MVRMRPRRAHRWLNNVHRESRYFVDAPVAKRHMFLPPSSTSLCPRPVLLYLWIVSSALSLYIMIPPVSLAAYLIIGNGVQRTSYVVSYTRGLKFLNNNTY